MKILSLILFNPITKGYLKQVDKRFPLNRRLKSVAADMFFVMSLFVPLIIIFMIYEIVCDIERINNFKSNWYLIISTIPFSIILFILLNKDFYNARSVAKRIYGYQILNIKTNEIAGPLKCALRNVTCIIWPVEAIFLLTNPSRRLGDFIAGTIVKSNEHLPPESILDDIKDPLNYRNTGIALFASIIFTLILTFLSILPTVASYLI